MLFHFTCGHRESTIGGRAGAENKGKRKRPRRKYGINFLSSEDKWRGQGRKYALPTFSCQDTTIAFLYFFTVLSLPQINKSLFGRSLSLFGLLFRLGVFEIQLARSVRNICEHGER